MAALLLAAVAGQALGATYDDFSRGINAVNLGDSNAAIAAFTAALNAGDLVPGYLPAAHRGRARAYLGQDMCAEALPDLEAAIKLTGVDDALLWSRTWAKLCSKDLAGAQKDFASIEGAGTDPDSLFEFGRLEWKYAYFGEAATTLGTAIAHIEGRRDDAAYFYIWQALSSDRAGTLDVSKFKSDVSGFDANKWPAPVFGLFLGTAKPEDVARAAASRKERTSGEQKCEADFYTAEWHLARKNKDAAIPLLVSAAKSCPKSFIEYSGARVELKREAPASLPAEE
jgi:tetratricopeptide (TPR) repeat protein